jgi:hypothetical protein
MRFFQKTVMRKKPCCRAVHLGHQRGIELSWLFLIHDKLLWEFVSGSLKKIVQTWVEKRDPVFPI